MPWKGESPQMRATLWPVVGFLLVGGILGAEASDGLGPINVCDLARRLSAYRNKMVAVRGEFFSGRHGATVGSERCTRASPFREFGSGIAINLSFPSNPAPGEEQVDFEIDGESLRRFEESMSAARAEKRTGAELKVVATFVGVLRVRSGFKLKPSPSGGYVGNGFGQLGRYPAELVMRDIRDLSITKVSEP